MKYKEGCPWRGLHQMYCQLTAWMKWSEINKMYAQQHPFSQQ